ncbi:RNA polymerase sigma factor RpoE [Alginatibacterium sediminis]|uniref:RNA polymerase sigma factor RpoE n=1 Tax=Alginatibacterium sediminis TaxID=2164068 RepID=A0A420ED52_9ALTE|nr:RNA polymerase sigma factor RpoE [Alginatibacterium sediminis]RKF18600.1 RNA polymerase sigma factor RpoE [Alginatibacterium sediminis]
MSNDATDLALVERVQRGDKSAFNLLVSRYQQRIAGLVSRYVAHPGDVADVTQEAFIKAYRSLPNFRGESAFYTWLYRIAVNTAKNYLTAQGRRPPANDVELEDAEYYDGSDAMREHESPESLLLTEEIQTEIFRTIDALPEELRVAITLREIDGLSYDEISNVMGCPVGTVRSRIFRARDIIDQRIKPLLHNPD